MTIRNKPKRRTTVTPEMLEILAKGIKRRRHQVAVVRAMLGILPGYRSLRHRFAGSQLQGGGRWTRMEEDLLITCTMI